MKNELIEAQIENFKNTNLVEKKIKICDEIVESLRQKQIIIYGAGAAGKTLYDALELHDLIPYCFIDRRAKEIVKYKQVCVKTIDEIESCSRDNVVIIVSVDPQLFKEYTSEIKNKLKEKFSNYEVVSYGRDLSFILKCLNCSLKLEQGGKFDIIDCINCGAESRGCEVFDNFLKNDRTVVDRKLKNEYNQFFGYIVGKNCTLKCKYCCELVPYFKERGFVDKETIIKDCKKLASASNFNMYIELVGGEPFLHPDLPEVLDELLKIQNVGYVKVFTNGTVPPNARLIKVLQNPRIVLMWSNYMDVLPENLLHRVEETRKILDEANIKYIFSYSQTWLDFSTGFERNTKTVEQLENDFKDCHIANCHRLYKGMLYRCPHAYAAVQLNKLVVTEENSININKYDTGELSEKLYDFKNLKYTEACKHCSLPYDANEVPAAEQLEGV